MEPFIGEIRIFAFSFVNIYGWQLCDGSQLAVKEFPQLFSIIGSAYGGDGKNFFNVPDLRNCVPMGTGADLTLKKLAAPAVGSSSVELLPSNFAPHSHIAYGRDRASSATDRELTPAAEAMFSQPTTTKNTAVPPKVEPYKYYAPSSVAQNGVAEPTGRPNDQPFLALNFFICTEGSYPRPD